MSTVSKIFKTVALSAMAVAATSCGGDEPQPNPGPGPTPVTSKTYNISGASDDAVFNKADSSWTFSQILKDPITGKVTSDIVAVISASTKAQGETVSLISPLLAVENVEYVNPTPTGLSLIKMYNYNLATEISREGKNIGKTVDNTGKIKDIKFDKNYGTYAKNVQNKEDVVGVMKNDRLQWKLIGQRAKIDAKDFSFTVN